MQTLASYVIVQCEGKNYSIMNPEVVYFLTTFIFCTLSANVEANIYNLASPQLRARSLQQHNIPIAMRILPNPPCQLSLWEETGVPQKTHNVLQSVDYIDHIGKIILDILTRDRISERQVV